MYRVGSTPMNPARNGEANMPTMKVDGGCHCGRITYEAEIDLDKVAICHCEDCKSFSGSEFRGATPALWFRLTGEEPSTLR